MDKIIRYFPLNKGIVKGEVKSFVKTIGIYIVSNMLLAIAVNILDFIPLVKNLLHHVDNVYELYSWAGSLLGGFQYFTGVDCSQMEFVKIEDVLSLWYNSKYKKYILIGAVVLCIIPYSGSIRVPKSNISNSSTITEQKNNNDEQQVVENESIASDVTESDVINSQETQVLNTESEEVTSEIETEVETEEIIPEPSAELLAFYDEVKGFWQRDENYCTFLRHGKQYYFLYFSRGKYTFEYYDVISLEEHETGINATIVDEAGISYNVTTLLFPNGTRGLEIFSESGINSVGQGNQLKFDTCSTYDEFLADRRFPIYYINKDNLSFECVEISKDSLFAVLDIIPELEGMELIVKEDRSLDKGHEVWAIQDEIVCPIGYVETYKGKDMFDPEKHKIYGYLFDEMSNTGYYNQYAYDTKTESIRMEKENVEPAGEDILYLAFGNTCEQYFIEKEKYFARLENRKKDVELIKKLADMEGFPEGYSAASWDSMQMEFDGMTLHVGETMLPEVANHGWGDGKTGNSFHYLDTNYTEKGHTYRYIARKDGYIKYSERAQYGTTEYEIVFSSYDKEEEVKTGTVEGKTIYKVEFDYIEGTEEERAFEAYFPQIVLPQGITYSSTREDIINAYGMPCKVGRYFSNGVYTYYSEDYTKYITLSISDTTNQVSQIIVANFTSVENTSLYAEDMKAKMLEDRLSNLESAKEDYPSLF